MAHEVLTYHQSCYLLACCVLAPFAQWPLNVLLTLSARCHSYLIFTGVADAQLSHRGSLDDSDCTTLHKCPINSGPRHTPYENHLWRFALFQTHTMIIAVIVPMLASFEARVYAAFFRAALISWPCLAGDSPSLRGAGEYAKAAPNVTDRASKPAFVAC